MKKSVLTFLIFLVCMLLFGGLQAQTPAITTAALPTAGGSVTGGGTYMANTTATLTAAANSGYEFKQWADGNTDNPRSVTVTQDDTFTALFGKSPKITLDATNVVVCSGSSTTLTATATDYTGIKWYADDVELTDSINKTSISVSPTTNTTYKAVAVNKQTLEIGTVSCEAEAEQVIYVNAQHATVSLSATEAAICSGSSTTLTATATDYTGIKWYADGVELTDSINKTSITVSPTATTTYEAVAENVNTICIKDAKATTSQISVGDIVTTDSLLVKPADWANLARAGKVAAGVVYHVSDTLTRIVGLTENDYIKFGFVGTDIPNLPKYDTDYQARTDFSGKNNTDAILSYNETLGDSKLNASNCAAVWAKEQGGYLPAAGEQLAITTNLTAVNATLSVLNGSQVSNNIFVSSSVRNNIQVWSLFLRPKVENKDLAQNARAVLAFPSVYSFNTLTSTCKAEAEQKIVVSTQPTIALSAVETAICSGSSTTLTATVADYTGIKWYADGVELTDSVNKTSITVSPSDTTTYKAVAVNADTLYVKGAKATTADIAVGDIVTTDQLLVKPADWAKLAAAGKVAAGVVYHVSDTLTRVVGLNEGSSIPWGFFGTDMPDLLNYGNAVIAPTDFSGQSNTADILAYNATLATPLTADQCAAVWANAQGGYLPAAGELRAMMSIRTTLNTTLAVLNGTPISSGSRSWSSSEGNANSAWSTYDNGALGGVSKLNEYSIRYVLAFSDVYQLNPLTVTCEAEAEQEVTVNPTYLIPETATVCDNETYTWRGTAYSAAGVYYDRLQTVAGCDSVYQLTLTVNPPAVVNPVASQVLCNGGSITAIEFTTTNASYLLLEQFENGSLPAGWSIVDADGDGENWHFFSSDDLGHTGKCISSASHDSKILTPDNWLITPQVTVANSTLSYWVSGQDKNFAEEHYGVYISTTGTDISDFTLLYEETLPPGGSDNTSQGTWYQRTIDLSAYTGDVYLAFRHFNISDMFWLNLDDVEITSPATIRYTWTNDNTATGLAASGEGNIASFVGTNATTAPIVSTITVTPHLTQNGVECAGAPETFTITVNILPGSEITPLTIDSAEDLVAFRNAINDGTDAVQYKGITLADGGKDMYFRLTADIDLKDVCSETDGNWTPIGNNSTHEFKGHFDGKGFTISNLYIKGEDDVQGLFGRTNGSEIKNVNLKDVDVTGSNFIGGLIGSDYGSSVQYVAVSGKVHGLAMSEDIGGIVGYIYSGTIQYCVNISTVTGNNVGGIAGKTESNPYIATTTILYCVNAGTVSGSSVGGIVGDNSGIVISCSYGAVSCSGGYRGGIVGSNQNSYDGSYYDRQMCALSGNVNGELTSELIAGNFFNDAEHWSEAAGRYPIPAGMENNDIAIVAATPIVLQADDDTKYETIETVVSNFTIGTLNNVSWAASGDVLTLNGANVTVNRIGNDTLTVSRNGYSKAIPLIIPSSEERPFEISSKEELIQFRDAINSYGATFKGVKIAGSFSSGKYFKLTADVALDGQWTPIGSDVISFQGDFNGDGHAISGLTIINEEGWNTGLFGFIENGTVKNLNLSGVNIAGKHYVGSIAGNNGGTITSCTVSGTVSGIGTDNSDIGGVAGFNGGTIKNVLSSVSVSGNKWVGGLVGRDDNTITNCITSGTVSGTTNVGAIVGEIEGNSNGISDVYYDNQMNTMAEAVGNNEFNKTLTNVEGKLTSALTSGSFFSENADWSEASGRYPIPAGLETTDAANVTAAAVFIADGEDATRVKSNFTVSTNNGVAWTPSDDGTFTVAGANVSIHALATGSLIVAKGDYSKTVTLTTANSVNAPYLINNLAEFVSFRDAINDGTDAVQYKGITLADGGAGMYFKLTADLDLSSICYRVDGTSSNDKSWLRIGSAVSPASPFKGSFDGGGHTIDNLYINTLYFNHGLFGKIENATVKNLSLTNAYVEGYGDLGGITGEMKNSEISYCNFSGTVKMEENQYRNYFGGICGTASAASKINYCTVSGSIYGTQQVGGICGYISDEGSQINGCTNLADVTASVQYVGGIVGDVREQAKITNCVNAGSVHNLQTNFTGGVAGYLFSWSNDSPKTTIENCLNVGNVTHDGPYGQGVVYGSVYGGISSSEVINCYYDKQMSIESQFGNNSSVEVESNHEGSLTSALVGENLKGIFPDSAWVFTDKMYPRIKQTLNTDASVVAAAAASLFSTADSYQRIDAVYTDFKVDKDADVQLSSHEGFLTILGDSVFVACEYGMADTLTMELKTAKRNVPIDIYKQQPTIDTLDFSMCENNADVVLNLVSPVAGTWVSSDESVAEITASGEIVPQKAGTVLFSYIATQGGCKDSVMVNVLPIYQHQEQVVICANDLPYTWRGTEYSVSGVYYDSLQTVAGCDSVYQLKLTVNPTYLMPSTAATICDNETYTWRGTEYSVAGVYYDSLQTVSGCDSVYQLKLTVNPTYLMPSTATICDNETYTWRGTEYSIAGVYYDSLQTVSGCDSVYQLKLTVNPTYLMPSTATICDNETYTWRGTEYSVAGVYYDSLQTVSGCDSVYELKLTVNPTYLMPSTASVCDNNLPYTWRGTEYSIAGVYYDSLQTVAGCDSVYQLKLILHSAPTVALVAAEAAICPGSSTILTATATDYTSIKWYADGVELTESINETSITVSPTATTTYKAVAVNEQTVGSETITCEAEAEQEVFVNAQPTVSIAATEAAICPGSSTTLTATATDYTSIKWYADGVALTDSINKTSIIVTPTAATTYKAVAENADTLYVKGTKATTADIAVGDIVTTDSLLVKPADWSKFAAAGKVAAGVVYHVSDTLTRIVGLNEGSSIPWGFFGTDMPDLLNYGNAVIAPTDFSGQSNTADILAYNATLATPLTADQCAAVWANAQGGYLPAAGELRAMMSIQTTISTTLAAINGAPISSQSYFWSSSEGNANSAWGVYNNGVLVGVSKTNDYYVRSALAFSDVYLFNNLTISCEAEAEQTITVNPTYLMPSTATICDNETYTWRGTEYSIAGVYYDSLQTAAGCDSVYQLKLTVNPTYLMPSTVTICDNETYTWRGTEYSIAGVYYDNLQTAAGCDSIYQLTLTVNPTYLMPSTATICDNETYTWRGTAYSVAGVYYDSLQTVSGCDSVYQLTLNVNPTYLIQEKASVCDNNLPYTWRGTAYSVAGVYYDRLQTVSGCDSVYQLKLTVNPTYLIQEKASVCDNNLPYTWRGTAYSVAGVYYDSLQTVAGCDSVYQLTLIVNPTLKSEFNQVACKSYKWNEQTYTTSGDYEQTFTSANGCDSIVTLHLTINKTLREEISEKSCDSYTWNEQMYTASGDYEQTFTSANGCDSIVTLHLTINETLREEISEKSCDSYTWNEQTYTASGDYEQTFTSANGCDSIVTLHLTVNKTLREEISEKSCDSYTWNEQTYTASGDYEQTFTSANGCDSIVTLHLTINETLREEISEKSCDSYTWNEQTYTTSGDYEQTFTSANGCDSIVTLHLTVNKTLREEISEKSCDSYTWNEQTYTTSGDYEQTFTSANGCDSIVTLHLTVNKTLREEISEKSCDSYTWNGQTYTASGDYEQTFTSANGCDSIVTLHLTIGHPMLFDKEDMVYLGAGYNKDGFDIPASAIATEGVYSFEQHLLSQYGCDSVVVLSLIVKKEEQEIVLLQINTDKNQYCEGDEAILSYQLVSGSPMTYEIDFDEQSKAEGFRTVSGQIEDVLAFSIPEGASAGKHTVTLQLFGEMKSSQKLSVTFSVGLNSDRIEKLWNDVVVCKNTDNKIASYQWYHEDELIEGATNQFYCDMNGLEGNYSVKVVTVNGDSLWVCEKYFERELPPFTITSYPNPAKPMTNFTVEVSGLDDSQMEKASLFVYTAAGVMAYTSNQVQKQNILALPTGEYVAVVTVDGGKSVSCKVTVLP